MPRFFETGAFFRLSYIRLLDLTHEIDHQADRHGTNQTVHDGHTFHTYHIILLGCDVLGCNQCQSSLVDVKDWAITSN